MIKLMLIGMLVIPAGVMVNESMTKDLYDVDTPNYYIEMLEQGGE